MNQPSLLKFEETVVPGGLILADTSLVTRIPERDDVTICELEATNMAEEAGLKGLANIVLVGKLLKETSFCSSETIEAAIRKAYQEQLDKEAVMRKNIHQAFLDAKEGFTHAINLLESTHAAALQKRDDTYDRVVGHLKTQLVEMKEENQHLTERASSAETARTEVERNRHQVFRFFSVIVAIMGIALVIALSTDKLL